MLSRIISERVNEIFDLADKELKNINRSGKLPAGIVLCGGGAKLPQICELAQKKFKLTANIGLPYGFSNLNPDPSLAVACGLVARAWQEREEENNEPNDNSLGNRIKNF